MEGNSGNVGAAERREIEITPEMIHEGVCVLLAMDTRLECHEDVVKELMQKIFNTSQLAHAYRKVPIVLIYPTKDEHTKIQTWTYLNLGVKPAVLSLLSSSGKPLKPFISLNFEHSSLTLASSKDDLSL
jgi:hypothetical protein